jgi:MinD-like ATPase involved in chromosome partitioning or flagellar assembly
MSLIGLCSAHGSPGVTVAAVALAATWPEGRRCLLIEADPFGGVIGARYGLGDTPGLSSLAAVARLGLNEATVYRHVQELPGGVAVMVGPGSADEAHAVLRDVAGPLSGWCATQDDLDVIVDCGRTAPTSPTFEFLAKADAVKVLVRPSLDQLRPAAHRVAALEAAGVPASMLLVGESPYQVDEVAATLTVDIEGALAWDPRTAAVLEGGRGSVRDLRRSPLVRSAATLAAQLASAPPDSESDGDSTVTARLAEIEIAEEVSR